MRQMRISANGVESCLEACSRRIIVTRAAGGWILHGSICHYLAELEMHYHRCAVYLLRREAAAAGVAAQASRGVLRLEV